MMKKKIVGLLLVLCMAASLAACGGGGKETNKATVAKEPDQTNANTPASTDTVDDGDGEAAGNIEKFDPVIEVTSVRSQPNPVTQAYADGEGPDNNAWTQLFEEKYGFKIKYNWLSPDDTEYRSKLNLDMTSGELADFFRVDKQQLSELVDADMIQPMDEVWEKYASERTKNLIETEGGQKVLDAVTYDGKMMAIPFTGIPKEGAWLLYIREDWLKNLNMEAPKTMDDVIAIAEAFASQDPDQNGKDDTFAITLDKTGISQALPLFYANKSYPGALIVNEDGELTTGYTDENTKEVLQLLNKWYSEGAIDPEWFTKDLSKAFENVVNGKVGIFFGQFSSPLWPLQAQHDLEPESDWLVMPVPGYDGKEITNAYNLGVMGYYVASREFEHPETIIMMLNEWVDLFYYNTDDEIQLKYINSAEGAEIWQNAPVQAYRGFKNYQCGIDIEKYYAGTMKMEELTAEERGLVKNIDAYNAGDEAQWGWNKIFGIGGATSKLQPYIDNDSYIFNEHWSNPTETEVTNGSVMTDYQLQSFTSFINGQISFDQWDEFVAKYREIGYDKVLEEYKEQYQLGN